jgi:hypothetical protein
LRSGINALLNDNNKQHQQIYMNLS